MNRLVHGKPQKTCLLCKKPCTRLVGRLCGMKGSYRFCDDTCQESYEKLLLEQMGAL